MAQKKLLHAIDACNYLCLTMPHTEDWGVEGQCGGLFRPKSHLTQSPGYDLRSET